MAGTQSQSASGPVFGPEDLDVLGTAYRRSVEAVVPLDGAPMQPGAERYARETLAKMVLGLARNGERDPEAIAAAVKDRMNI